MNQRRSFGPWQGYAHSNDAQPPREEVPDRRPDRLRAVRAGTRPRVANSEVVHPQAVPRAWEIVLRRETPPGRVDRDDHAPIVEHRDVGRERVEGRLQKPPVVRQRDPLASLFEGVTDGALQRRRVELALDQIIGRTRRLRRRVDSGIAHARQDEGRREIARRARRAQQIQPVVRPQVVIDQGDVVLAPRQRGAARLVGCGPFQRQRRVARRAEIVPHEQVVVLIILDQQNPQRHLAHHPPVLRSLRRIGPCASR